MDQFFKVIKAPEEILILIKGFANMLCHNELLLRMVALLCVVDLKLSSDVKYIRQVYSPRHNPVSSRMSLRTGGLEYSYHEQV